MTTKTIPTAATVNAIAASWAARFPESAERIERAIALVDNVTEGDRSNRVFFVEGSEGHRYMVRVDWASKESTCTCPDSTERGAHCKHRWAAALVVAGRKAEKAACQLKLPL